MRCRTILAASLLVACSGGSPPPADPDPRDPTAAAPAYALNEWGLISARTGVFEIAAGPGRRPPPAITVDKPVLYVHSEERFALSVGLDLPAELELVEHYPPAELAPLRWRATVGPHCAGSYPGVDDSRCPDGYCEVAELPTYETPDAACLEVGSVRAPLLFYRVRARAEAPALPLEVRWDGEAIAVSNRGLREPVGSLWRVARHGGGVAAMRAEVPPIGGSARLGRPTDPVAPARDALRAELVAQGLRESERDAFLRAWDEALFGPAPTDVDRDGVDQPDIPRIDTLRDGTPIDDRTTLAGPRLPDVLLYWLDAASIARLAPLRAEPPPREVHRAWLVRVAP